MFDGNLRFSEQFRDLPCLKRLWNLKRVNSVNKKFKIMDAKNNIFLLKNIDKSEKIWYTFI